MKKVLLYTLLLFMPLAVLKPAAIYKRYNYPYKSVVPVKQITTKASKKVSILTWMAEPASGTHTHTKVIFKATVYEDNKQLGKHGMSYGNENGTGRSRKPTEKDSQRFFTTKPTGEETALGLSLSYDIVKAHDGELKAETTDGQCSTFIVSIPANKQEEVPIMTREKVN